MSGIRQPKNYYASHQGHCWLARISLDPFNFQHSTLRDFLRFSALSRLSWKLVTACIITHILVAWKTTYTINVRQWYKHGSIFIYAALACRRNFDPLIHTCSQYHSNRLAQRPPNRVGRKEKEFSCLIGGSLSPPLGFFFIQSTFTQPWSTLIKFKMMQPFTDEYLWGTIEVI